MSNETILQRALNVLMGKEETATIETAPVVEVEMAEKKTIDGTAIFDSENFAIGEAVFLIAEDGTQIPVPMGEYQLEDGTSIVVDDSGIIVEVATGEETEEVEAMMPEDMQNQPMKEQIKKASEMTPKIIIMQVARRRVVGGGLSRRAYDCINSSSMPSPLVWVA
jgi:hypothetical protein